MINRRQLMQGVAVAAGASFGLAGYAVAEPRQLAVKRYRLSPPRWPDGLALKLAVLSDFHVCEPWMGVDRVERIVHRTNALEPDAVLLLGDYRAGERMLRISRPVADRDWARALARLRAPLGVHAVLGNHDWWDDPETQINRRGPTTARLALEAAGIPVYENDAVRLAKNGRPFWLAGLGDQWAFRGMPKHGSARYRWSRGVDNLPATLAQVTDEAPVVLMVHEPDIFPAVPSRVAVTLAGHTHGGQVRVPGLTPRIPSRYGARYAYGHIVEEGRHMLVTGGLGCSALPVRIGMPPEVMLVELTPWSAAAQS